MTAQGADPRGKSEPENIEEVRDALYRFLKWGMSNGSTFAYAVEKAPASSSAVRLFGADGKSFTITVSR